MGKAADLGHQPCELPFDLDPVGIALALTLLVCSFEGPASMPANPRSKSSSLLEAVDLTPATDHSSAGFGGDKRVAGSSSALATPRDDLNWVNLDFSAEVERLQQTKARKARTDMESFSMPLNNPPATTADEPGRFTESPQETSDTTPDDAASPSEPSTQPPADVAASKPVASDHAPATAPTPAANSLSKASGSSTGNHHRRSLSLRSSLGSSLGKAPFSLDAGKSSPQRMSTLFAQPRVVSSSSTISRESVDQRPRRNISAKIDGWWKSVVGNIGSLNTSVVKPPAHHATASHHHLPLPKPANLPRVPPPAAGAAPSSPTPTIGFAPVANPVPAAATTSLKHATSLHELANPSPMPPPVRPIRAHTELGPPPPVRRTSRSSIQTIPAPSEQSLDARRRQPALHLRLSQQQGSSATVDSPSESSSGAERGSSVRPPLRPSVSRSSSFGTTDDSPEHSSRRVRTVSNWGQSPGALYAVLADDGNETPPLGYDELAVTSREFNKPAVNRQVKAKVAAEKKDCDRRLKKIIHEITVFVERKLEEANRIDDQADSESALLASAMDSQSDFGGDEPLERYEVPPMRRRPSSRPASRRPSVSFPAAQGSPARRIENLPPVELRSPGRRRPSTAIPRPHPDYRIPRQPGFNDDPISNTSSRSTSRSRSPMPPAMLFPAADPPATDEQTQLPNLFLATVQATIDIATEVLDTPVSTFMARPGSCQEYVQRMIDIRNVWQENPQWPGRDWYVIHLWHLASRFLS